MKIKVVSLCKENAILSLGCAHAHPYRSNDEVGMITEILSVEKWCLS